MIDNWHDRKNSSLVSIDRFINITCRKDDGRNNLKTVDTILTERKDYSYVVRSSIESQENNNRKDDIIETIQKKKIDGDKEEKGIIRKGIVKDMLERIKRQQGNSTLTNSKDGTLK